MREIDWEQPALTGNITLERWAVGALGTLWAAGGGLDSWLGEPDEAPGRDEAIAYNRRRIVRTRQLLRDALDVTDDELTVLRELERTLGIRDAYRALLLTRAEPGTGDA